LSWSDPVTESVSAKPVPLAVLISGGGTTLLNLIRKIRSGELAAEIRLVISSNPDAGGLRYAEEAKIPWQIVSRRDFASTETFSETIFRSCQQAAVDLIVMGGFLKHVQLPSEWLGRVVNIHPALIPAFCGKGFYGLKVHQAVLEYGCKVSGCTVHFVDNEYDHGPIILQEVVPVRDDDTPESLAARVFERECRAYPEAIRLFGEGRLQLEGRRVAIR
jgi:phosphoribosylglycinamide formyltransferase-1